MDLLIGHLHSCINFKVDNTFFISTALLKSKPFYRKWIIFLIDDYRVIIVL